jgi:hypothetical protein
VIGDGKIVMKYDGLKVFSGNSNRALADGNL